LKTRVNLKSVERTLRSYLGLKYHLVGIKLMMNDGGMKGPLPPKTPMAFCQLVRTASSKGDSFLYGLDYEKCPTAQVVLGFRDNKYLKVDRRVTPPETRQVLISPLDDIGDMPEVVLAILTPRQMMDLTLVLKSMENGPLLAEFTGEHACAEFFAKPYIERKPNVSLLCGGAREIYSDFRDSEIIFGAPLQVYLQAAETIERITKMAGALCGCRTSDIPSDITNEFEKIGLSKGTDYFFGKVKGRNIRVYVNKDPNGTVKLITIHSPVRMPSEEKAGKVAWKMRQSLPRPYFVDQRGYWLDLAIGASEDVLGIDLFNGFSIKAAIEKFIEKTTQFLNEVETVD